jgi:hypothetical protein
MKKKSLIGLTVGLALIIVAVWLQFKPQESTEITPSSTPELDGLLSNTDKDLSNVEQSIKDLDNIDESLDDEQKLALLMDSLLTEPVPSADTAPSPEATATTPPLDTGDSTTTIAPINTSDLDTLLEEIDAAANAANNSISDFDSINEDEDKVNI